MSARTTVKAIQDIMRQDVGVDGDAQRISQLCWMFFLKIIDDQDQEFEVMRGSYCSPAPEDPQWRSRAADPEGITGDALLEFIPGVGVFEYIPYYTAAVARPARFSTTFSRPATRASSTRHAP